MDSKIQLTERSIAENTTRIYNRTMIYLVPSLNSYGEKFRNIVKQQQIATAAIDDIKYAGRYEGKNDNLFMLFKLNKEGNTFLQQLRQLDQYRDDYLFADLVSTRLHMAVFYYDHARAMSHFLKSEYSKMYSDKEIMNFYNHIPTQIMKNAAGCLAHNEIGKEWFQKRINLYLEEIAREKNLEYFTNHGNAFHAHSKVAINDPEMEYDFPLDISMEVFNYDAQEKYGHKSYAEFINKNIKNKKLSIA